MKCDEIREILSGYVDGEARSDEGRLAEEHLAACAGCRDLVRRMRLVGAGIARTEAAVPPGFRETVFGRMEREDLLPRRRGLIAFPFRWVAIPLAAAAALALFVLMPREAGKVGPAVSTTPPTAMRDREPQARDTRERPAAGTDEAARAQTPQEDQRVARRASEPGTPAGGAGGTPVAAARVGTDLTPEERDIVAHLEVLEDPAAFEEPSDIDELEIVEPAARSKG